MQQLVAISRAMVTDSKVLILDEPTSSLDAAEVERLFDVVRRLRDQGVAILFVSHFLDQVYAISDRITVLRNGQYVGEYLTAQLDRADTHLQDDRQGTLAAPLDRRGAPSASFGPQGRTHPRGDRSRTQRGDRSDGLRLHRGEVVGFAGLLGSGRTELARLLYGADRADSGTVLFDGRTISLHSPAAGLAHRIAYSSENRRDEGVIADLTVRENLVLAVQARRGWMRRLSKRDQAEIVDKYIAELGIRPANPEVRVKNLSGGNQQKVLLGRWLATRPDVLILDEPTRGIDIGAKAEIQAAVVALSDDGVAVVYISSEIDEVVRLSDRVVILKDRCKIDEIDVGPDTTTATVVGIIAGEGAA